MEEETSWMKHPATKHVAFVDFQLLCQEVINTRFTQLRKIIKTFLPQIWLQNCFSVFLRL